jgi:hypothetical protein
VRACLVVLVPKEHGGGKQWETSDASCDAIDRTTSPRERERRNDERGRQTDLSSVAGVRRQSHAPAYSYPCPGASSSLSRSLSTRWCIGASSFSYGGGGA